MPGPAHRVRYSLADYLALELGSNVKHEFWNGEIYAMAGGTPEHAALAATVIGLLFSQLRAGPCRILDADLRVRVAATGLTTYPDATVVCGPRELDPEDRHAVTNPTVVIEVFTPSTESYDRGDKRAHYQTVPSLAHIVLVASTAREVEVWSRTDAGEWASRTFRDGERAELPAVGATLDVSELYAAAAEPA